MSSAYWQAARRTSDLVRTSVCWTIISVLSMPSRISLVIFSVRVWSNFWCCISLPPLQQECNGPADVQNAAVGVGEFRDIMKFLNDSGYLPTELATLFIRYARIVLGKEDTGIALCEIPEVPKLGIIPITSYVHSVVYSVGSIYFHVFSSVHICICIGIYTRVNNGAGRIARPYEQLSRTDRREQASISFSVISASAPDAAYHFCQKHRLSSREAITWRIRGRDRAIRDTPLQARSILLPVDTTFALLT